MAVVVSMTLMVMRVEFVRVTELTVIPVPENVTDEVGHVPELKFAPVMTTDWLAPPWPREPRESDETVGAEVTVNPPASVARPRSCRRGSRS